VAGDGLTGLELASYPRTDLVILDLMLADLLSASRSPWSADHRRYVATDLPRFDSAAWSAAFSPMQMNLQNGSGAIMKRTPRPGLTVHAIISQYFLYPLDFPRPQRRSGEAELVLLIAAVL
jgi:hypothetical protein